MAHGADLANMGEAWWVPIVQIPGDGEVPGWYCTSADLAELGAKTGIHPDGLARTIDAWNHHVADESDPDFGRGSSAYDGYWGDNAANTPALQTLGPIDTAPYFAVPVTVGAMGTKGGPRTDCDGRVLHVNGEPIAGLYAAGNAMAGVTGKAYGGAGGNPWSRHGFRLPGRACGQPSAVSRDANGVEIVVMAHRSRTLCA